MSQQLVILAPNHSSAEGELTPLGSRGEVLRSLHDLNTAPDHEGGDTLYGPGIIIEMPPQEPITQMLLTIVEEEIAWQVIVRIAKRLHWRLLDPLTGREFMPS